MIRIDSFDTALILGLLILAVGLLTSTPAATFAGALVAVAGLAGGAYRAVTRQRANRARARANSAQQRAAHERRVADLD